MSYKNSFIDLTLMILFGIQANFDYMFLRIFNNHIHYLIILFVLHFILCKINNKINIFLFYNFTFTIFITITYFNGFNFLNFINKSIEPFTIMLIGFIIFIILDLIVTAIYFKKNNNKNYIIFLIVIFLLTILIMVHIIFYNLNKIILNITFYLIFLIVTNLFAFKAIFFISNIICLIYKSITRLKNYKTNQSK